MLFARRPTGERVAASRDLRGQPLVCPLCREPVQPKCGDIVTHHFAHLATNDDKCDPWSEGEGAWHLAWKSRFPAEWCEHIEGPHRADVRTPEGWVIEFQRSSISIEEIHEREMFWRTMRWVFDACEAFETGRLRLLHDYGNHQVFRWESPRKTAFQCRTMPYFDLGNGTLLKTRYFCDDPLRGKPSLNGYVLTYAQFVARFGPNEAVAAEAMEGWRA